MTQNAMNVHRDIILMECKNVKVSIHTNNSNIRTTNIIRINHKIDILKLYPRLIVLYYCIFQNVQHIALFATMQQSAMNAHRDIISMELKSVVVSNHNI